MSVAPADCLPALGAETGLQLRRRTFRSMCCVSRRLGAPVGSYQRLALVNLLCNVCCIFQAFVIVIQSHFSTPYSCYLGTTLAKLGVACYRSAV